MITSIEGLIRDNFLQLRLYDRRTLRHKEYVVREGINLRTVGLAVPIHDQVRYVMVERLAGTSVPHDVATIFFSSTKDTLSLNLSDNFNVDVSGD